MISPVESTDPDEPALTASESMQLFIGVERMKGGLVALDGLYTWIRHRMSNYETRLSMKIGNEKELLVRRAELADVLAQVAQRHQITASAAQGVIKRHPLVFGESSQGAPPGEQAQSGSLAVE